MGNNDHSGNISYSDNSNSSIDYNSSYKGYEHYTSDRPYVHERTIVKKSNTALIVGLVVFGIISVMVISVLTVLLLSKDSAEEKTASTVEVNTTESNSGGIEPQEVEEQEETVVVIHEKEQISTPAPKPVISTMYVDCGDFLALKSGPGIDYKRILKILPGEAVGLLEPISGEFVKVRYNGQEGYVAARYLSSSKPVKDSVVGTMYVDCGDFLALKSGPGIDYKRILKILPGEAVSLLEPISGEFVKVRYNGQVGYVAARYLSSYKPSQSSETGIMYVDCGDFLALKSGPGINYERILKILPGEAVELLEPISGEFVKVSYNGLVGYVAARYLSSSR